MEYDTEDIDGHICYFYKPPNESKIFVTIQCIAPFHPEISARTKKECVKKTKTYLKSLVE